jgi:hypothetical protein
VKIRCINLNCVLTKKIHVHYTVPQLQQIKLACATNSSDDSMYRKRGSRTAGVGVTQRPLNLPCVWVLFSVGHAVFSYH